MILASIILSAEDQDILDKIQREPDMEVNRFNAKALLLKLCTASWSCESVSDQDEAVYKGKAVSRRALAREIAGFANIPVLNTAASELWIMSFFAQAGFENSFIADKLRNAAVRINGKTVQVDLEGIDDPFDIDGYISFEAVLLSLDEQDYLILPADEWDTENKDN